MQRRLGQIDMHTGEILEDGFVAYVVPRRKNGFTRWMSMSQEAMLWLSRDAIGDLARQKLGLQEMSVFWCLMAHVEYENYILTPQAKMAANIGMKRTNFSAAVRKLTQRGIFEKGPKIGRMVSLKLNPEYGWKGSAQNHVVELQSERRRRMKAAGISGVIDGNIKGEATPEHDPHTLDMIEDLS